MLDVQEDEKIPRGAFGGVRYEKGTGGAGFPVIEVKSIKGFDGAWLPTEPRSIGHVVPPKVARIVEKANKLDRGRNKLSYTSPVYMKGKAKISSQYYPDPFAQTLIISLRYAGTNIRVKGKPLVVDIYKPASRGGDIADSLGAKPDPRNALAIALTVKALDQSAVPRELTTDNLLSLGDFMRLDKQGKASGTSVKASVADARQVILSLPSGVGVDVDYWFAPSVKALTYKAAIVQGIAISIIAREKENDVVANVNKSVDQIFQKAVREQLPALSDDVKKINVKERPYPLVAPGGLEVPMDSNLVEIAARVHQHLLRNPLPEVSSVETITCTHASNNVSEAVLLNSVNFHRLSPEQLVNQNLNMKPSQ